MQGTLTRLPDGASGTVGTLKISGELKGRLMDLGFTPGARVTRLFAAPSGDPAAYYVRGSVIALRRSEAELVTLREERGAGTWA